MGQHPVSLEKKRQPLLSEGRGLDNLFDSRSASRVITGKPHFQLSVSGPDFLGSVFSRRITLAGRRRCLGKGDTRPSVGPHRAAWIRSFLSSSLMDRPPGGHHLGGKRAEPIDSLFSWIRVLISYRLDRGGKDSASHPVATYSEGK